ncbi:MAG: hypothetical protein IT173_15240 [Acidobacteria bacterium]|nr:hypothetical protein [Acidobacteriota bacterium]
MSEGKIGLKIIIPCIYVGLAVISYLWDFEIVLNLLGVPWSIPLMMLSGLIVHATVNGNLIISVGSLIGVLLNVGIFGFISRRTD